MADIKEAIRRLIYQYTVEGADKVMATQEAVAASTTKTDKASLSLEKSFGNIERRYVDTVRAQQDYQKVQERVNAAVAQNPALQERANVVLAQAKQHFENIATGAGKADIAATVLIRTMSRTIGPLAAVGVAVAAISSAMEFMQPIAVRVGTDIYNRFSQAYPAVAQFAEAVYNAGKQFYELERAKAKVEAIDAALKGVASSAQLADLNIQSMNQKLVSQRGLAEAAEAAQRIADHVMRLREIYPGVTQEVAKQLELMDAQLAVAKARTEEERQIAEEKLRQVQLTQQGVKGEEQQLIIARERAKAEAEKEAQGRKDNVYYSQNATDATNETYKAQARVTGAVNDTTDAYGRSNDQLSSSNRLVQGISRNLEGWPRVIDDITARWRKLTLAQGIASNLDLIPTQMQEGRQFTYGYDPFYTAEQKAAAEQVYGAGNIEPVYQRGSLMGYRPTQGYLDQTAKGNVPDQLKPLSGFLPEIPKTMQELIDALRNSANSTDALNNTMQNALSPFYSQDPRTTHLGFRAGVTGNPDWLAAGASNANPLAAILGPGATAPGMAGGGSFVVGGGYSANDNRIAAFPVASGEEVVVNRNRSAGSGGQVIHIDNRIIVTGTVDSDTLSKLKVSKYQQAQRMRAGLAQAS